MREGDAPVKSAPPLRDVGIDAPRAIVQLLGYRFQTGQRTPIMALFTAKSLAFLSAGLCAAAMLSACSNSEDAEASNDAVEDASAAAGALPGALVPGGGGGDPALQETMQEIAPEGETALSVETLAEGLVNPWGLAFLPNGDMLVTEREGRIRIIREGALVDDPVAGAPEPLVWNQGGYFDVLPHPDFAENNILYLSYAHGTREGNATRVVRGVFDGATLSDVETIYEVTPLKDTGHHFGGRMAWGGDGRLYLTTGDGGRYQERAQDMATSFGAVVRLNEDGSLPADNPTFGPGSLPELYSKGHRNPQGLVYDAGRGVLWSNEHGPRGGDEINDVQAGANYGWPAATYGINYNGSKVTPFTEFEGARQPVKYWTPSIAPSGMAVYRGDMFAAWEGDLLVGAMADHSSQALHRVIMDANLPIGEERYLVGERIRDVRVGPDGAVYVTTEDRGGAPVGKVLRLTPRN